jgi:hypothetical protein
VAISSGQYRLLSIPNVAGDCESIHEDVVIAAAVRATIDVSIVNGMKRPRTGFLLPDTSAKAGKRTHGGAVRRVTLTARRVFRAGPLDRG